MSKTTSHILSAVLRYLKSRPDFESVDIVQYRTLLEKSALAFKPDKSVRIETDRINGIEAEWLIPKDCDPGRMIMYVHGGGYIAGSITSHRDLGSRIAAASCARTLVFNYRLAPEHPFPAGLEDVKTVYASLGETVSPGHRICLAGDSAGAGLCLGLLAGLSKAAAPLPACTVLISPWIDLELKNPSLWDQKDADPMLSPGVLKKAARLYTDQDLSDPRISPINSDFNRLTPVLIQAGSNEVLLDDSKLLARKLEDTGTEVCLEVWDNMFHVWHYFARYLKEARQAIDRIGEFVGRHAG